jgi:hypothetical protein
MEGAGSYRATNFIYNTPKDGTSFALIGRDAPLGPLSAAPGARYDATKLSWIGTPTVETNVCIAYKNATVKTAQDLLNKELVVGDAGAGSSSSLYPKALKGILGLRFRVVSGYPATSDVLLAMERGAVEERTLRSAIWPCRASAVSDRHRIRGSRFWLRTNSASSSRAPQPCPPGNGVGTFGRGAVLMEAELVIRSQVAQLAVNIPESVKATPPNTIAGRPGPDGACSDAELAEHIRQHIAASRLHGEGYRKLRACGEQTWRRRSPSDMHRRRTCWGEDLRHHRRAASRTRRLRHSLQRNLARRSAGTAFHFTGVTTSGVALVELTQPDAVSLHRYGSLYRAPMVTSRLTSSPNGAVSIGFQP